MPPSKMLKVGLADGLKQERLKVAASIADMDMSRQERDRFRLVSGSHEDVAEAAKARKHVLYWMRRDQRVQDNWAMLHAQKIAMDASAPLTVAVCLPAQETRRRHHFRMGGLNEVEAECGQLDIGFRAAVADKQAGPAPVVAAIVDELGAGCVVTDFSPLREPTEDLEKFKGEVASGTPIYLVDAHNIVPAWVASPKLEYAARTIRPKINGVLDSFLKEFPPVVKHPYPNKASSEESLSSLSKKVRIDETVKAVDSIAPGYLAGLANLESFVSDRLQGYAADRNDPNKNALSKLSFWVNFGQISMQRAILYVKANGRPGSDDVKSFVEEAVIRRELSDNFCLYNENYDNLNGAYAWARETLNNHRKDKREFLYTKKQFEDAETHDELWNAAERQMKKEGKIHGFLRMYWAKKILEWSDNPDSALSTALYLNDHYCLDGCDPNGYVGVMWSICGIHDQGWAERPVFGKIRFMAYSGCKRKFDVAAFEKRYMSKS